ncbi:MAG TPA: Smr/MutS family protein [Myxococcales bacterium]|nr:Smr/MutS family protein [Myxococcales bacterium]
MAKKPKPFNNPFGGLKLPEPEKPAAPPPAKAAEPAPARPYAQPLSDEDLWSLAVDGAAPLQDRSGRVRPSPQPIAAPPPMDPELAAYDELRALVEGEVPFDISDSDEYIEGHARGLDPRVVRKLKRGEFAVQAHVDLHGLLKEEAKAELEQFFVKSRQAQKRCVLVVHGRGLHSKDQVPVLKDALKRWMATARFARHVLAFATARPHDGGGGAIYVLLKK